MPEPRADAKYSGTGSDAISLPRGTDASMENLCILSPVLTADLTRSQIANGAVVVAMAATPGATIQASCSPLSADDERRLARIRKDRANRFMVAAPDVDFLLEILERVNR
jgi:hypothetical protein